MKKPLVFSSTISGSISKSRRPKTRGKEKSSRSVSRSWTWPTPLTRFVCSVTNREAFSSQRKAAAGKKKAPGKPVVDPMPSKQDSEAELMTLIEERHKCQEHGKACFVQSNGEHYQYTHEDLTIWTSLLVCISDFIFSLLTGFNKGSASCND